MARTLRPTPSASRTETDAEPDPLNPEEDEPSNLDDRTHAEFLTIFMDASDNIRFAKLLQWNTCLYFSGGTGAITAFMQYTGWADAELTNYLLILIWIFSVSNILIVLSLQWWQAAEQSKIAFVTSKWSLFSTVARSRKSKIFSDIQRYGMMTFIILYLELVTFAVTRIFLEHM